MGRRRLARCRPIFVEGATKSAAAGTGARTAPLRDLIEELRTDSANKYGGQRL